jgi:hypothetical protein
LEAFLAFKACQKAITAILHPSDSRKGSQMPNFYHGLHLALAFFLSLATQQQQQTVNSIGKESKIASSSRAARRVEQKKHSHSSFLQLSDSCELPPTVDVKRNALR